MLTEKVLRQRWSVKGQPFVVLEDQVVPRIHDNSLDCVIYLYHSRTDAERGSVHPSGGSGFLVAVPAARFPGFHSYAVSNRHVVETSPVVRVNTMAGDMDVFEFQPSNWLFTQTDDIAVCPIALPLEKYAHKWIPVGTFITPDIIKVERIGPGDDVFIVGRFVNHEGKQRNMPSARFGNIAMMPDEPVFHQWNTPKEQLSFLADIRTIGGYSGSPVFLFLRVIDQIGSATAFVARSNSTPWLLGVEWGHLLDHRGVNTGMSGVVPAWRLAELLNSAVLVMQRHHAEEEYLRQHGGRTQVT
jgi:hypothetical protein